MRKNPLASLISKLLASLILEADRGLDFGNRPRLILGGAAVHRCDDSLTFNSGFSR
jgi:hypothetical protein